MEKYINKIIHKLKETIPNDVEVLKNDIEQNFQSAVNAKIKKLDLVTREEFEIQEIKAIVSKQNVSSQRLLEKLGFEFNGLIKLPNEEVEVLQYKKLK